MKKRVSLQKSLFRNLLLGPVILGVMLTSVSLYTSRELHSTVAAELTGRAIAVMDSALVAYLRPVDEIVNLSVRLGRSGRFENGTPEHLDTIFSALLESIGKVSSIHVATGEGREYMLLSLPEAEYYNRISDVTDPGWVTERRWTGSTLSRGEPTVVRASSDYDIRQRPWYTEALASLERASAEGKMRGEVVWSDPYTFFTTKEPGITASIAYRTASGATEVLAFDILLTDILNFARQTQIRSSGIVFVLLRESDDKEVVVLAVPPEQAAASEAGKPVPFPLPVSHLADAPRTFVETVFDRGSPEQGRPVRFQSGGDVWWGATARSPLSDKRELWIAATIPEVEVLSGIPDETVTTLMALLATIGFMVILARWLARRYGDPIGELVAQTERMSRLNFSKESQIESPIYEVEALATSQDAMRRSLAALATMNDQNEIARDLRALSGNQRELTVGGLDIGLIDEPANPLGGTIPIVLPVAKTESGAWVLSTQEHFTALAVVLVETQLSGMETAKLAIGLRATTRTLLKREIVPIDLLDQLSDEFVHGTALTAPVGVLVAFVDGTGRSVEICQTGATPYFHLQPPPRGGRWHEGPRGSDHVSSVVSLGPGDLLVMLPQSLFDIMSAERKRFDRDALGSMILGLSGKPIASAALGLRLGIQEFAAEAKSGDVALVLVACRGGPVD